MLTMTFCLADRRR